MTKVVGSSVALVALGVIVYRPDGGVGGVGRSNESPVASRSRLRRGHIPSGPRASRQRGRLDLTLYGGVSLPRYEQTFRFGLPNLPNLPNITVTSKGDLVLDAKGGPVFGGALARKPSSGPSESRHVSTPRQ